MSSLSIIQIKLQSLIDYIIIKINKHLAEQVKSNHSEKEG